MGGGPSLGRVGQVAEKTRRDDRMPSVLGFDSREGEASLAPKVSRVLEEMTGLLPGMTGWLRGGVVCIETPQFGFGLVNSFLRGCFAIPPLSCLWCMLLAVVCFSEIFPRFSTLRGALEPCTPARAPFWLTETVLKRMLFGASCNLAG